MHGGLYPDGVVVGTPYLNLCHIVSQFLEFSMPEWIWAV